MARIPTAANVGQAPSPRDPGVSVPAIGQDVARAAQGVGQELTGLADRRRRVSEAVDRTLKESKARELAFQSFNDWQSSGTVAEEDSVSGFVRDIETEFKGMLDSHTGGPESRARLQSQLEGIRLDTIFKASTASTMARREILVDGVQRRVSENIGTVFQSAANLDEVLTDYDATLDDVSDALGDSVTFQLKQRGRETFVKSAMDGAIARGDFATVDSLLSDRSPYRQFISPEASTVYRAQLAKGRSTATKLTAQQSNILFAKRIGLNLTAEQKAAMLGAPVVENTQTTGEKAVAAAERAGITLSPEQRAAMLGVPEATDPRTPEEKAVAAAERAGITLTDEQRKKMLGVPVDDEELTPEERSVAAAERAGITLTDEQRKKMLGVPGDDEELTTGQKNLAALEDAGITVPAAKKALILGMPDDGPPSDFEQAVRDRAAMLGVSPEALPPTEKQVVWEAVFGGGASGPFEGTGLRNQMFNRIITDVEAYAAGNLTAPEQRAFEASVVELAADRTNPITGEVTRGSVPVDVLRALDAQGKWFDSVRNVIMAKDGTAPSAPAPLPPPLLRDPNLGPMNGAPSGAATPAPAPAPGASLTDSQLLDRAAAYGQGASDDVSAIAQANLFGRAEDIAGPVARIDAAIYGLPFIGPLLTGSETTDAQKWGTVMSRAFARARQQSPRFAVSEFEGLLKEVDLSGSAWDNPDRFRQGLVVMDGFLEAIEKKGEAFVASGTAPNEEKRRIATTLNDIRFVREGLGVKQLPHPKDENEITLLPPGTVFIYEGQHYTRAAGSTN